MIIVLPIELFEGSDTPDAELNAIFLAGRRRYKIRLKPSYRVRELLSFETWLLRQSSSMQTMIRSVLDRGLTDWEFNVAEPSIRVERRESPEWPDGLVTGPIKLPPSIVEDFIGQRLELLLENGRNDWGFLNKIVPTDWKTLWKEAIDAHWITSQGSGITEIPPLIREQIALDPVRRLRTWVMFDRDGRCSGHSSKHATLAQEECQKWSIPHHLLERRAIENYIPKGALLDWARRHRPRDNREWKLECVNAYLAMTVEQRHYYNVAEGFQKDRKSHHELDKPIREAVETLYGAALTDLNGPLNAGLGGNPAQDIWGNNPDKDPYVIPAQDIAAEGFEGERAEIFQSIFAML